MPYSIGGDMIRIKLPNALGAHTNEIIPRDKTSLSYNILCVSQKALSVLAHTPINMDFIRNG
jgi:hypothetical protein